MSILKCTECGHDVSSYAEKCPNCGCPVSIILGNQSNEVGEKKFDVLIDEYSHAWECKAPLMRFIKESSGGKYSLTDAQKMLDGNLPRAIITSVDKDVANSVVAKIKELGGTASIKESTGDNEPTSAQNIKSSHLLTKDEPLKCPRCGSTAVTTTSRGYSLMWGFAGSNKTVNRCGKCGYTWKP